MTFPEWITIAQAASMLDVHRTTLYRWQKRGLLVIDHIGHGAVLHKGMVLRLLRERGGIR